MTNNDANQRPYGVSMNTKDKSWKTAEYSRLIQQRDAALKLADKYLALSWTPYINPGIELRAIFEEKP